MSKKCQYKIPGISVRLRNLSLIVWQMCIGESRQRPQEGFAQDKICKKIIHATSSQNTVFIPVALKKKSSYIYNTQSLPLLNSPTSTSAPKCPFSFIQLFDQSTG